LVWVAGGQYGLAIKAVYKIGMHKSQTYKVVDTSRIKSSNKIKMIKMGINVKIQITTIMEDEEVCTWPIVR
jgi:hypothetical protein